MIATITPDRGDRSIFLNFCIEQLKRMSVGLDVQNILVCDQPTGTDFDLVKRIRKGIAELSPEVEFVYIVESDDFYPDNYLDVMETMRGSADFIGFDTSVYYNIRNRTWNTQVHPGRSSLFCTGFKPSALNDFFWPPDHYLWLDIRLWEFAKERRKEVKLFKQNPCVGVKHGTGVCAGKAHKWVMENRDPDLSFLRSKVSDFHFDFYSKLKL